MAIIIKKKGSSNKDKTLGNNHASTTDPDIFIHHAPRPFIDRLSIVLKVPTIEDAKSIHSGIWTQLQDSMTFQSSKNQGGYKRSSRIKIPTVLDAKKWPYFQYDFADGHATRIRLDFIPVDLGHVGLMHLHAILTSLVPDGWMYFIKHSEITRLDVAVDFPDVSMTDFHYLPKQGATTIVWLRNGKLGTFQHGQGKSPHTQIYSREDKRKAQGKGWQNIKGIRVERRLRTSLGPLRDLGQLENPFQPMKLVQRVDAVPVGEAKPYIWRLFRDAAELKGLPAALATLPEEKRTLYRKHFEKHVQPWWGVNDIWAQWHSVLCDLKLIDESAWT